MLVKICVPSRARASIFHDKTFQVLKHCTVPWCVVIDPQDYQDYVQFVPAVKLIKVSANDLGFGYALATMRKHCLKAGFTFGWKMDDDVHHAYVNPRVSSKEEQAAGLLRVVKEVLEPAHKLLGRSLGGISFANKLFHTDWRKFTHANKMFEGTYIVRTDNWFTPSESRGYNDEPIASAYLLTKELVTLRTGLVSWGHDMSTYPGGLQLTEREIGQTACYAAMERKYPEVMAKLKRQAYLQKSGKTFTVVDKKDFNRRHSTSLPLKHGTHGRFSPGVASALEQLPKD